jgi:ATP-dependent Lhr-like helicase
MLITTPETLQAILPSKAMRRHLRSVQAVVIDEIHELAQDKRGAQLTVALERLRLITRRRFQRIGLSATVGDPEMVADFLVGPREECEIVRVNLRKKPSIILSILTRLLKITILLSHFTQA